MFVVNSRLGLFSATASCSICSDFTTAATLIPKLRVHFAEFLNEGSPAHLRILSPPTCVGFGTGDVSLPRSFSRQCGVSSFSSVSGTSTSRLRLTGRGFACVPSYTLVQEQPISCLPALLCHSIAQTIITGTGISASCPSPTLHASD